MAIGSASFMHSISISYIDFLIRQASLSSPSNSQIRHRFPSGRRLNFLHPAASQRFGYFSSRCSITNTDVELDHVRTAEAHVQSSTVEPDCPVPIVKLNSDILETEPLNLLTEATNVDCLLTALPVLSEEEQQAISASPAHPAGCACNSLLQKVVEDDGRTATPYCCRSTVVPKSSFGKRVSLV